MTNAELFGNWLRQHGIPLAGLQIENGGRLFRLRHQLCALSYLRAYWKGTNNEPPNWQPHSWLQLGEGWTRFLRADQALDWLLSVDSETPERSRIEHSIWKALYSAWLVPIDELWVNCQPLISRRVEAVRVSSKSGRLVWTRKAKIFPELMRQGVAGLDAVHTPENEHAGLTRYLCEGWSISDSGQLETSPTAKRWGPSTLQIPYRLFDAPRRLMLGANLQMRAVPLVSEPQPTDSDDWQIPGCKLRAAFSCYQGWTHEDAIVISESAAIKLARCEMRNTHVSIPAVASRIEILVERGKEVQRGDQLLRVFIDLFALGWRRHEAIELGADDGWLEIGVPGNQAPSAGSIIEIKRNRQNWFAERKAVSKWRETITFTIERLAPVRVGDKLSTRHGLKGVVSRIVPDAEMPEVENVSAEIVLSPIGTIRRSAMGQFREADPSATLPHQGTMYVMRQPQDAEPRCRTRDAKQFSTVRGQRFGEMEFWALMAHNARHLAFELLSPERSTSRWMQWEREIETKASHRSLCTRALNRFLSMIQIQIEGGRIIQRAPEAFPIASRTLGDFKNARDLLEDSRRFCDQGGLGALTLTLPVQIMLANEVHTFQTVYILPPWLRPAVEGRAHPLTKAYLSLLYAVFAGKDLRLPLKQCIRIALSHKRGAGGFLRREVLGRRLKRSARAVIIPRPDLRIDQVSIPEDVANSLFAGLPDKNRSLVLLNRNPTLHQRGMLAMRPVVDPPGTSVFGLPPGVLKVLGADFDGDQAAIFALETEAALQDASRLIPGQHLRTDYFRPGSPAFPLSRELRRPLEELALAQLDSAPNEWCDDHMRLVRRQLEEVGDGWETETLKQFVIENAGYLAGLGEDAWLEEAQQEMRKVYSSVRKKGQLGGIIRQQILKRAYVDDGSFSQAVAAVQAVTERLTQSALSVKAGGGAAHFDAELFFQDPIGNQRLLAELDPSLDASLIAKSLGSSVNPSGLLAWMARPRFEVLLKVVSEIESQKENAQRSDPRIAWFID